MKQILTEIVDRLLDLGASLDALEAELIKNGTMKRDAIGRRFAAHKSSAEASLFRVRAMIARLPEKS